MDRHPAEPPDSCYVCGQIGVRVAMRSGKSGAARICADCADALKLESEDHALSGETSFDLGE